MVVQAAHGGIVKKGRHAQLVISCEWHFRDRENVTIPLETSQLLKVGPPPFEIPPIWSNWGLLQLRVVQLTPESKWGWTLITHNCTIHPFDFGLYFRIAKYGKVNS